MKKLLITVSLLILANASFADVRIVKSNIEGDAIQVGNGILIKNPRIRLGRFDSKPLNVGDYYGGTITGEVACELLGFDYVNLEYQSGAGLRDVVTVRLDRNGAIKTWSGNGNQIITELNCKEK